MLIVPQNIPGILAQVYQDALERKRQQVEEWHRMVKSVKFDQEQRDQLNKLVQSRFQASIDHIFKSHICLVSYLYPFLW